MVRTVTHTIGPRSDYPTLAAYAAALPRDLVAAGEMHVGQLSPEVEDPGGAVIHSVCDARHHVLLCTDEGAAFDRSAVHLAPCASVVAGQGPAIRLAGERTRVVLRGLRIAARSEATIADDGRMPLVEIIGCVIEAESGMPAARLAGVGSAIRDSLIVQRGSGPGIALADGAVAIGCTVVERGAGTDGQLHVRLAGAPRPKLRAVNGRGSRHDARHMGTRPILPVDLLGEPGRFAGERWRAVGATVDPKDTIPGPLNLPLQRLSNVQNAFARFDGPGFAMLAPGAPAALSVIVAAPTTLSSALVLSGDPGRVELRVVWTETPPGFVLLDRTEGLVAAGGGVVDLGCDTFCLTVEARNASDRPICVAPSLHVTRGIENAGLAVGMHAGVVRAGCPAPPTAV